MLPSKIRPTTSLSRLTTGLPELPPMMSAVETKFSGVSSLRRSSFLALNQLGGRLEGATDGGVRGIGLAVELIALGGPVGQAEREGGVGVDRFAQRLEHGAGDPGVLRGVDPL